MPTMTLSDRLTAVEMAKRDGYTPDQRRIIEAMQVTNQILLDAPVKEANDRTVETNVVRTALPHAEHRTYYQGVGSKASQTKRIQDVVCQLAIYSEVDKSLVDNAADPSQALNDECASFLYGMGEDQADDIVYGNHETSVANINGLAVRRPKIDGKYCIDMGGKGNKLTSVYLIKWGSDTAYYIFPKDAKGMGVQRTDKGVVTVEKADGTKFEAYRNYFQADYGITVKQEGALIRLANIDPSKTDTTTIIKQLFRSKRNLCPGAGTIAVYSNSEILGMFDEATMEKNNVVYSAEDPWGNEITKLRDIRLRQVDAILATESAVTA